MKKRVLPTELAILSKAMNYIAIEALIQKEMLKHTDWLHSFKSVILKQVAFDSHFFRVVSKLKKQKVWAKYSESYLVGQRSNRCLEIIFKNPYEQSLKPW